MMEVKGACPLVAHHFIAIFIFQALVNPPEKPAKILCFGATRLFPPIDELAKVFQHVNETNLFLPMCRQNSLTLSNTYLQNSSFSFD